MIMKEVNYPHIEESAMNRNDPFHPITKEQMTKPANFDCIVDRRFETGMVFCKEEKSITPFAVTVLVTAALIVFSVFIFAIDFEVKHLEDLPVLSFFLSYPQYIIITMITIIVIVILRKRV